LRSSATVSAVPAALRPGTLAPNWLGGTNPTPVDRLAGNRPVAGAHFESWLGKSTNPVLQQQQHNCIIYKARMQHLFAKKLIYFLAELPMETMPCIKFDTPVVRYL